MVLGQASWKPSKAAGPGYRALTCPAAPHSIPLNVQFQTEILPAASGAHGCAGARPLRRHRLPWTRLARSGTVRPAAELCTSSNGSLQLNFCCVLRLCTSTLHESTTTASHSPRALVGLVSLDFFIIVDEVLAIPLCLALYISLPRVRESLMLTATALSAASIVCFLIATPVLNMLYLSQQYAAATTALEREGILAAGQGVLSSWLGTPFQVGIVVGSIGMLLIGWVILAERRSLTSLWPG